MDTCIPVILCIDVEPDSARPDPNLNPHARWRGFERLYPYLRNLRLHIAEATGKPVRFNWFWRMDPQVEAVHGSAEWALRRYAAQVAETIQAGDAHGLHTHAWRWDARAGWVKGHDDPSWVESCLMTSCQAFRSVFAKPCESIRMGDRYFDDRIRGLVDRLGVRFDLTVEPGETALPAANTTSLPDYGSVRTTPYRPSVEDFRKQDEGRTEGVWIIPLTAGVMSGEGLKWRRYLRRRWSSVGPIPHAYGTLRLWEPPELVQPAIGNALTRSEKPYLAFAIRSDVLLIPWWSANCRRNLEGLSHQREWKRFLFCSPDEALSRLGLAVPHGQVSSNGQRGRTDIGPVM